MRIPIDYYRILGVLIDADQNSIDAAYHDRKEQQPRREYSELALQSRQNLMDEAYAVLSRPSQRGEYNKQLLEQHPIPKTEIALPKLTNEGQPQLDIDPHTPLLQIQPQELGGALSILQELGEYEIVSNLGRRELKNRLNYAPEDKEIWQLDRQDIILSIALASLQRGREEYQKRDYEKSAFCQQEGFNLLRQEGVFPYLQEEIQNELYSLRPYRILGLLALEVDSVEERQGGLHLLKDMLQERGGIEGKGDDRSGLSNEEFLRFIEQLRGYLTIEEQLELFEVEANRPSGTGVYLLAYTLLAKGFAHKQPQAIVRVQELLKRFDPRQDVYLERAICALLLGQTESASNLLVKSQETESIAFIQEHSQGEPDLLPGLCLYGERWLEGEVLSEFRDLHQQKLRLKDYFADRSVQQYLEDLANSQDFSQEEEFLSTPVVTEAIENEVVRAAPAKAHKSKKKPRNDSFWHNGKPKQTQRIADAMGNGKSATATAERGSGNGRTTTSTVIEDDRAEYFHSTAYLSQPDWAKVNDGEFDRRHPRRKSVFALIPAVFSKKPVRSRNNRRGNHNSNPKLLLLGLTGFMAIVLLTWFVLKPKQQTTEVAVTEEQPLVSLQEPAIELPNTQKTVTNTNNTQSTAVKSEINESGARQLVEKWLAVKSLAMGSQHDSSQLTEILDGSLLKLWQGRSRNLKNSSDYWQYQHTVTGVTILSPSNGKSASIQAKVKENATYYRGERVDKAKSYDQNLIVNYDLVYKNNHWTIANIRVN